MKKIPVRFIKKYTGIIVLLMIIFFTFFWLKVIQKDVSEKKETTKIVSQDKAQKNESTKRETTFSEETALFVIDVAVPVLPFSDNDALLANEIMKNYFEEKVKSFKEEVEAEKKESNQIPLDAKSSYTATSELVSSFDNYFSFHTEEMLYSKGAAHPSHTQKTFVYNKKEGKLVNLTDIFLVNDSFYQRLEKLAEVKLEKKLAEGYGGVLDVSQKEWIKEGLSDKADSFKQFTLNEKGIIFYFDEYVVAPYAAGPQEISISFDEIKEFKK